MHNILSRLFEPKTNSPEITFLFVKLLGVKISKTTIKRELEADPNFPSLLSISDLLQKYGIENISAKIDLSKLKNVPLPCVTQIKGVIDVDSKFFTIISRITNTGLHFFDPEKSRWTFNEFEKFKSRCSGIILLAEVTEHAGEKRYEHVKKRETEKQIKQIFIASLLPLTYLTVILLEAISSGGSILLLTTYSILTILGASVGVLLLWYEIDQNNPVIQQICSPGRKVNCGAILKSKASKIAGISWSVIGTSYFIGIALVQVFFGVTNPLTLSIVAILNLLALPYVFYSIYYQSSVAKQWCILCLAAQVIMVAQLTVAIAGTWYESFTLNILSPVLMLKLLISMSIPFIFISLLLPALQNAKYGKTLGGELKRLKSDPKIFEALLTKEKMVTQGIGNLGIKLGNPAARYQIIKVCSPYCGPCGRAHESLENLLEHNPDIQVEIIFQATDNNADLRTKPVRHLLALDQSANQNTVKEALDDWYAHQNDYDTFAMRYPVNGNLKAQGARIKKMEYWCEKAEISFTPTLFISMSKVAGQERQFYQLPTTYSVDDLKYFLDADLE